MFNKRNENEVIKGLFEKNRNYTYEEIKKIFKSIEVDVCMNPFGDAIEEIENKLSAEGQVTTMLIAIPIMHTIKQKLFGSEK